MKKFIFLILVVLSTSFSYSQTPSNCIVEPILQTEYDIDVTDLALRRMHQINSPDTILIDIPQSHKDTIWEGLAAIFNAPSIYAYDSVFNIYCVHQTMYCFLFADLISIEVDTSYLWTQAWQNQQTITGYTELDNLLSNYGFEFSSYISYNIAYMRTSQYINFDAIADSLETFDGINFVTTFPSLGDGNEITYNKIGNERFYNFSVKYYECPLGCTVYHTWKYKVLADCSVEFLEVESNNQGISLPEPPNCNISLALNKVLDKQIIIYPNPVVNNLQITFNNLQNLTSIVIFDIFGKQVLVQDNIQHSANNTQQTININVSSLQSGIYFVRAGEVTKKIVKL